MNHQEQVLAVTIEAQKRLGETRLSSLAREFQQTASPLPGDDFLLSLTLKPSAESLRLAAQIAGAGWQAIPITDPRYPVDIRQTLGSSAPPCFFGLGNFELAAGPSLAIVGTRRPGSAGRRAATSYAEKAVSEGWTVVSGNAPGIDACAHSAALKKHGATIIFPPSPPDSFVPSFTWPGSLNHVLVLTPFIPGSTISPWNFLRRNEFVAALCAACLVAETGSRGGTLNTISHINRLQKPLFIADLPPEEPNSATHVSLLRTAGTSAPVECTDPTFNQIVRAGEQWSPPATFLPEDFFAAAESEARERGH